MSKNLEVKQQLIDQVAEEIKEKSTDNVNAFVFNYSSLSSAEMNSLRSVLYENSAKLTVVKNTLIKKVFGLLNVPDADKAELEGQNAILISGEDFITPIKELVDFIKKNEKGEFSIGVLGGNLISSDEVKQLSNLPSKEQLIGQVVGGFSSPIRGFVYVLNGVQSDFVRTLEAIREKKSS